MALLAIGRRTRRHQVAEPVLCELEAAKRAGATHFGNACTAAVHVGVREGCFDRSPIRTRPSVVHAASCIAARPSSEHEEGTLLRSESNASPKARPSVSPRTLLSQVAGASCRFTSRFKREHPHRRGASVTPMEARVGLCRGEGPRRLGPRPVRDHEGARRVPPMLDGCRVELPHQGAFQLLRISVLSSGYPSKGTGTRTEGILRARQRRNECDLPPDTRNECMELCAIRAPVRRHDSTGHPPPVVHPQAVLTSPGTNLRITRTIPGTRNRATLRPT